MSLPRELLNSLPLITDADLYDMVAHAEEYLPEAVAAARNEMSKRRLAPERVAQLEDMIRSRDAVAREKNEKPLNWGYRILFFLFGGGVWGLLLALYFENRGYRRKALDCWIALTARAGLVVLSSLAALF